MIRKALIVVLVFYFGLLAGEIPVGTITFGRATLTWTQRGIAWTNTQLQALITYAGFGDSSLARLLGKPQPTASAPTPAAAAVAPRLATVGVRPPNPVTKPIAPKPVIEPKAEVKAEAKPEADGEGLTSLDKEALRKILE